MMTVFEVYLAEGTGSADLLSAEVLKETGAQIMTLKEAEMVGFQGLQALEGAGDKTVAKVKFDVGEKRLLLRYAPLTKVEAQ